MNSYDIAKIHGQLSKGEIDLLKEVTRMANAENPIIVNIGAGFGTSAIAMLEEKPGAFVFSVDKAVRPEELVNVIKCDIESSRVIRVLAPSDVAGMYWPTPIDILFVDGDHGEEPVKEDIKRWVPKVKSGGFVLFHDYNHPKVPWVKDIVDKWAHEYWLDKIREERYLIGFRKLAWSEILSL